MQLHFMYIHIFRGMEIQNSRKSWKTTFEINSRVDPFNHKIEQFRVVKEKLSWDLRYYHKMGGFRPNSEIIGIFREIENFYGHFIKQQKMMPTAEFWVRRRVLKPRYRNIKSYTSRPGQRTLKTTLKYVTLNACYAEKRVLVKLILRVVAMVWSFSILYCNISALEYAHALKIPRLIKWP